MQSMDPAIIQFLGILASVSLAAAAASGIAAFNISKLKKYLAASLIQPALALGFILSYHHEAGWTYAYSGALGIYLVLVSIPLFGKMTDRITAKASVLLAFLAGGGVIAFMLFYPQPYRLISKSIILPLIVDIIVCAMYIMNRKHRYLKFLLWLLPVVVAFHLEYFGAGGVSSHLAKAILILMGLGYVMVIAQESKTSNVEMMAQLERLEKEFEDEVFKGVKTRTYQIERIKDRMAEVNRIDHLTKALNRKAIMSELENLVLSKNCQKFVMLIFDIDKFKSINDTLGHPVGDECLKSLAKIAMESIRDEDFLGRYGGDEFIILLPNQSLKIGLNIAERFRNKVDETKDPHFSISIGASAYPWDGNSFKTLLEAADKGLYVAKEQGKNRVAYAGYIKLDQEES